MARRILRLITAVIGLIGAACGEIFAVWSWFANYMSEGALDARLGDERAARDALLSNCRLA